jgi:BirA family biotin operon repressor/biotin-[acetyl-CoA-carboxylase] ligase
MPFALGPVARAAGYRLIAHETIGSTSSEAMQHARDGDPGRLWIASLQQTAGHGRRGRPWQTPAGNLAASLLMPVPPGAGSPATLGFAAGLALDSAIRATAPGVALKVALDDAGGARDRLRLKWPNDVLVDGAKVAGILLEAVSGSAAGPAVVVGIGVNVRHAPVHVPYPATSLAACGAGTTAEALFAALSDGWVEAVRLWSAPGGFAQLRDRWLARAAGLGSPVAVRFGDDIFRGTFETIDDEGRLIVRNAAGVTKQISAGDVHFGAVASEAAS